MAYVILGGGGVTAEFYLPAFELMGRTEAVTVVDPSPASLAPLAKAFPWASLVESDHQGFLAGLKPGGDERIIVALPNALHVGATRQALDAGRHVLCEKPLALSAAACTALAKQAKAAGLTLRVAMSRRYLAALMLARQMVTSGDLGAVRSVEVRDCSQFLWRPRSFAFFAAESGGVLADMGVHYLDFLDTVVGPMKPVSYEDDARGGTESNAQYRLSAGKVPISLKLSRLHPAGAFVRITGERGEILIDKSLETGVTYTPTVGAARLISVARPFDDPSWPATFHGSFCQMLADFERAINGETTPIAEATDAARATALIEWAYVNRPAGPVKAADAERVLVTGATGFIGGHLVERLTGQGLDVAVAVRSPASLANVSRFPVDKVSTDLTDPASVARAVAGARTVYHLAYGKEGDAARITVEGTKTVVEAAIAAGCEAVVVLSTMYVFGFPPGDAPVDETFPYRPYGGEYAQSKMAMERWCLERAKTSGATRIVVITPTCVFGPGGGAYTILPADLAAMGQFGWISEGAGSCNYTYVDNVVDALLAAAATPAAHGQRFIINDGVSTWRAFLTPIVAPLGSAFPSYTPAQLATLPRHGGRFRWRDLAAAAVGSERVRVVAKRSSLLRKLFDAVHGRATRAGRDSHALSYQPSTPDTPMVYPPDWLADLFGPAKASFSAAKARSVLGWTPRVGLAEAQARTLDWVRESGRLPPQDVDV